MRWTRLPTVIVAVLALGGPFATQALGAEHPLCRLVLADESNERDDLLLELDLARSEFAAAEEIYGLIERLWKQAAVERLIFLLARHGRDTARLDVERRRLRLDRQEAVIDQYRYVCEESSDRVKLDAAFDRYRTAQCGVTEHDVAIAEVDLAYQRELLQSVHELRQGGVATRQDTIRAERDVELARKRLEQGKRRVEACRHGDKGSS